MAVLELYSRDNHALDANPPAGDSHLVVHGSDWLWAVTAVYMLTFLAIYVLTPRDLSTPWRRTFHHILVIANFVGAIVYFASASDLGWSVVTQADQVSRGLTRQIFFTKYILWVVSFPVAIICLGLLAGTAYLTIIYQILLSWIWVISYLVGAYTASNYKWGFFVMGTVAWLFLAVSTFLDSRGYGNATHRHHMGLTAYINFLWMLYPIAWGLSDGGNRISVTGGWIFFGILDLLFMPVFSFGVLNAARSYDYGLIRHRPVHTGKTGTTPTTATGPMTAS